MTLAALGLFVFELSSASFDELNRRTDWRYATGARVGARDAHQYVEPGDDIISIPGTIYPEAIGSYGAIDTLRAMAEEGEAYQFVEGTGKVLGSFVIVGLDEGSRTFLDNGVPRRKDFQLDLKRVA